MNIIDFDLFNIQIVIILTTAGGLAFELNYVTDEYLFYVPIITYNSSKLAGTELQFLNLWLFLPGWETKNRPFSWRVSVR
jgi:hypothetical protein